METNLYSCTRTGRTISEKTMDDDNIANTKDDKNTSTSLANLYGERPAKLPANGHELAGEPCSTSDELFEQCRPSADALLDDKFRKRINPLKIHLGKRPFVDNSHQCYISSKKKKTFVKKNSDTSTPTNSIPRAPKLIPKRIDRNQFHNVTSQAECSNIDNESDKPVPRLVPKSQLQQYKRGKLEKGPQLKEYAQSLGLQPMVKFKCRKCCSMSFKTLAMLKEHQVVCRAQAKEPALSPEAAPNAGPENNGGAPPRVTRKLYLCSACGTYYENWNLFLHMREVHNRHICLFCLGMFSKAEKLSSHLTNKHNVKEFSYNSKEEFFNVYNGTLYLMCCVCDEICSEQDDFFNHDCYNIKPKPVPVLVSKNSVKPNNVKPSTTIGKNSSNSEITSNGPTSVVKESIKPVSDKKEISETKLDILTPVAPKAIIETKPCEMINSDTSISSESSTTISKDTSNTIDSGMELECSDNKPISSPVPLNTPTTVSDQHHLLHNGDDPDGEDSLEQSDESDSPEFEDHHLPDESPPELIPEPTPAPVYTPTEREKEGGIKIKLSLNNANSPVIINSTVDPTVGQQIAQKPPSRVRRPPKRYEKEMSSEPVVQQKTPSIKMTICDRADSPFVKTTIYENNKETTVKTLLNNNLESASKTPEQKPENTIKTTIYDNKLDDDNTLNRVPKLTVRVPKELLDKDSSSDYSSDSDVSDKLTVDENNITIAEPAQVENREELRPEPEPMSPLPLEEVKEEAAPEAVATSPSMLNEQMDPKTEPKTEDEEDPESLIEPSVVEEPKIPVISLSLDKPIDKYPLKDLLKVFVASTMANCIYCNHARKIAVNCEQLTLHMVAQHRFTATVNSITAEELMPETITAKLQVGARELKSVYINLDSYDSMDKCEAVDYDHTFECFQCYFKTTIHKDLYIHYRKMHQKTISLCVMCKTNFSSYSELLCHLCPGTYDSDYEIKFRCVLCNEDSIPSQFRLMVHLRKVHHTCDVCLEFCLSQLRLSNHVWKHKLHHLCYRCGIAYRNKLDITNHLFWKHGTQSVMCKKCQQKKWPHVYHFCIPPATFGCDECSLQFTKALYLKVHKRFHAGEFPHVCTELDCTEKFVSKKLLSKHLEEHRKKLLLEDFSEAKPSINNELSEPSKELVPIIDLVDNKPTEEAGTSEVKAEAGTEQLSKKAKKKKLKDKDALLLDVNLPALNLSESDSSDESDSGISQPKAEEQLDEKSIDEASLISDQDEVTNIDVEKPTIKVDEKTEIIAEDKPDDLKVLDIWDNFKKHQAKVEKQKTPPLVPIKKHVCESDHDYCLIPTDMNGDDDMFSLDKKKNKKSPKKERGALSSSSSSSSDSDSSCSCGSNCSCSSSSASSSSSSSDSDTSDESGTEKKKTKRSKKTLPNRRLSNGSNVDVMGMTETPVLIPEKVEPPIAESDLETTESDTDEEFYDKNPQLIANKVHEEKRNQLMLLASGAPSDGGSVSGEASRPATPIKEEKELKKEPDQEPDPEPVINYESEPKDEIVPKFEPEPKYEVEQKDEVDFKEKPSSSKKKSKKKKKSKSSRKRAPIKINIPKDIIGKSDLEVTQPLLPNKITISLQSNTVQLPEAPLAPVYPTITSTPASSSDRKRASKRRRVPNKFYGYSSDEEGVPGVTGAGSGQNVLAALKPQQPPKLEWRKEDLPSPVTHKTKKEVPSTVLPNRLYNYTDPIRLTAPIPDPEPPRILMNTESLESSESDSSDEGNLEINQSSSQAPPIPPPTYINSGTSSLPYAFQRPAVRQAREGESVYCYCRCPYDEVSEMIACDAEGCSIEWFHFECVGIMVPPKGKWYCPECRKNQTFSGYR